MLTLLPFSLARFGTSLWTSRDSPCPLYSSPPGDASTIKAPFVSYGCEFSGFSHFSGDGVAGPNDFSYNLLRNLGIISGTLPYWRIGGNSADLAIYVSSQTVPVINTHPGEENGNITTGPRFYQGFQQWPGVKFIHGFNQRLNGSLGRSNLKAEVDIACHTIGTNAFLWEFGNEADLYSSIARPDWDVRLYVAEWLEGTAAIKQQMAISCPELPPPQFISTGFAALGAPGTEWDPIAVAEEGITRDSNVGEWSVHKYMQLPDVTPPPTLQGTLMNHTNIKKALRTRIELSEELKAIELLDFTITETNSILNIGEPGVSDVFGAALWSMDYQLYAASSGAIQRIHMQQGFNFWYNSWQPVDIANLTEGTRPPYYGDLASTTALGDATNHKIQVLELPLSEADTDSGYAIYENGKLARVVAINLVQWNAGDGTRPNATYSFSLPNGFSVTTVTAERLMAPGADVKTGISFNGYSYEKDLNNGLPVRLDNTTSYESVAFDDGIFTITVPYSSAVVLNIVQ